MNKTTLIRNVETVIKFAQLYDVPVVLSIVNMETGRNDDTIPRTYDRTSINAWEDKEYNEAIKATGRNKIIILGL